MSELDLLCECINTEGETEGGGVKFVWMDENTIYRFENNRMKKIGKQLLNKAKRELTKRSKIPKHSSINEEDEGDGDESQPVPRKSKSKVMKKNKRQPNTSLSFNEEEDEVDDELGDGLDDELQPVPRKTKGKVKSSKRERTAINQLSPHIDLDEYYNNKHKMEYMTLELTRLNNKIGKLKQYKSIVNRLTGGEIDDLPNNGESYANPQSTPQNTGNSAWQTEPKKYNDTLFLY